MNSHITEELIETLQGIKEGKEWEARLDDGIWFLPPGQKMLSTVIDYLSQGFEIRLKPSAPESPSAPDFAGWIEWKGGPCPEALDTVVSCRLRNGSEHSPCTAGSLNWNRAPWRSDKERSPRDIIAYRVDARAPQPLPEYVPWTFETFPKDRAVWITGKHGAHSSGDDEFLIHSRGQHEVSAGNIGTLSWASLFSHWITSEGEPCGTIKQ